jgi:hypothetical protein
MPQITIDTTVSSPQVVVLPRLVTVLRGYEEREDVVLSHDLRLAGAAMSVRVIVETAGADRRTPAALPLVLRAAHHASWFPTFHGQVCSDAVGPLESILRLDGRYEMPLAAIGEFADSTVLGHAAERSLRSFLDRLRRDVLNEIRRVELDVRSRARRT